MPATLCRCPRAKRAGLKAVWLNRDHRHWPGNLTRPDAIIEGLGQQAINPEHRYIGVSLKPIVDQIRQRGNIANHELPASAKQETLPTIAVAVA